MHDVTQYFEYPRDKPVYSGVYQLPSGMYAYYSMGLHSKGWYAAADTPEEAFKHFTFNTIAFYSQWRGVAK